MARQINSGSLPFALTVDSYSTISPSLGENSPRYGAGWRHRLRPHHAS